VSYLALYRQWRPQRLGEIVGQRHVTETLRNALVTGKVSHAYLFCGPRGTGKTSTAKVLARAINCPEQQRGEPCNQCRNCREIQSGATMDVIEIDAASNRGIDEIRELRENIKFFPSRGSKRIYIVDEVHMLTNEAFNALLKTLEEPPGHVVFVLATTEPHKVPLTILSRCQRFDFRPIPGELIAERLEEVADKSDFRVDGAAVRAITRAAGGSLRDALSVLDQALLLSGGAPVTTEMVHSILGTVREDVLSALAAGLAEKRTADVIKMVADIAAEGKDLHLLAGELAEYLRHLLVIMLTPEGAGETAFAAPQEESPLRRFNRNTLVRAIDLLVEAEQSMRRSAHPRVLLELALVRAMDDSGGAVPDNLLARIERLEQALLKGGQTGNNSSSSVQPAPHRSPVDNPRLQVDEKPSQTGNTRGNRRSKRDDRPANDQDLKNESGSPEKPRFEPEPGEPGAGALRLTQAEPDKIRERGEPASITASGGEIAPKAGLKNKEDAQKSGAAEDTARYSVEQIRKWWPDMLDALKKKSPAAYTYLYQAWPAEIKDRCLVLGVPSGDVFLKQMVEDAANRELLAETLHSFTHSTWQVRCGFYDAPPPGWGEKNSQLGSEGAISLFQGEEVPLEEDLDKN